MTPLLAALALAAPFDPSGGGRAPDPGVALLVPDARGDAAPDRRFDVEKLVLDLAIDPDAGTVAGTATLTVRRLGPGALVLDQVALAIEDVAVDGKPAPWRAAGDTLSVEVGDGTQVAVRYHAKPRTGLHFRPAGPDGTYPEVWSQGEMDDNRHWFPGWDHPNDRFAYEGRFHVPDGWTVVTNSGPDLVNYLVMVAAAPYEKHGDDVDAVWVPPGTSEAAVRRVLDPIPKMKAHFAERTGVDYAWGSYRQVFVQRFLWTGMENTGATIEDRWLVDDDAIAGTRGRGVEKVVAHELAHQWFGDLLTCHTWRELWLNEGFASFMAADWQRETRGAMSWAADVRSWFRGSRGPAAMALRFHQPDGPPHANVYGKGASTLQMLRVMLGEDVFWAGVRRYVGAHAHGLVESDDLRRAMEDVSGQELGWFFEQWVELPTVPALQVSHTWEDGTVEVVVRQTIDAAHPRYTLPVTVEIAAPDGLVRAHGWLDDGELTLRVPAKEAPRWVAFDPDGGVLATVDESQSPEEWERQLLASPSPYARLVAADALAGTGSAGALRAVLGDEAQPIELRRVAAEALGQQRATSALLPFVGVEPAELRADVVAALGNGVSDAAVPALRAVAQKDPSPDLRGAAIRAIARLDPDAALPLARAAVTSRRRVDDRLVGDAADVLGEHGGPADLDRLARVGGPDRARSSAAHASARIVARMEPGKAQDAARRRVSNAIEALLDDPDQRLRETAVALLGEIGDARSVDALEALRRRESLGTLADAAREAARAILARPGAAVTTPNEATARIEALEKRLEALEKREQADAEAH